MLGRSFNNPLDDSSSNDSFDLSSQRFDTSPPQQQDLRNNRLLAIATNNHSGLSRSNSAGAQFQGPLSAPSFFSSSSTSPFLSSAAFSHDQLLSLEHQKNLSFLKEQSSNKLQQDVNNFYYLGESSLSASNLASSIPSNFAPQSPAYQQQIPLEEITTIFVVGFPEDMYEREFQNMFTFCPGFEAATLKIPSSAESAENDNNSTNSGRKQIIGFAKFRTRNDAIEARNILSGRKVDAERGCVLKAEMAKKNLHTKRGLSNEPPTPISVSYPTQMPPRRVPPPGFANHPGASAKDILSAYSNDPFNSYLGSPPPLPRELLNSTDFGYDVEKFLDDHQLEEQLQQEQLFHLQQQIQVAAAAAAAASNQQRRQSPSYSDTTTLIERTSTPTTTSNSIVNTTAPGFPTDRFDMLDLRPSGNLSAPARSAFLESQRLDSPLLSAADTDNITMLKRSNSASRAPDRGFNSALYNSNELLPQRMGDLRINTYGLNGGGSVPNLSAMVTQSNGSPLASAGYPYRTGADQNPPCNTLYVGNLPPNTSEQELLQLFSRSLGFKRLLFRNRPNGPMCFVEFDDVSCATLALHELSGSPLSNSTKGGIRLSYSKNPLGVRQTTLAPLQQAPLTAPAATQ
ncbi:hypothetical protein HK096_005064, partial [Nowakowskiella sp. JEL0078]